MITLVPITEADLPDYPAHSTMEEGFDDQGEIEEVTMKMFSRTGRVYVCDVERDWFVVDG